MRRILDLLVAPSSRSHRFVVGRIAVFGRRSASRRKRRALLFSDSFGPTLQVNFIRPLTGQPGVAPWGVWSITETARDELPSGEAAAAAERDLARIFELLKPDVVVASRYGGPLADAIVALCRSRGIPLITHLDDNLFDVPAGASASRHASLQRQKRLRQLLAAADLDFISTAALHGILEGLGVLGSKTMVAQIAGAAPLLGHVKRQSRDGFTFGYMGTRSHAADLAMVAPAIARLLEQNPNARFELFGSIELPADLARFAVRRHPKIQDYERFLRRLAKLDWAFGLAPLETTPFTLAKTNIKWIEYTAAGIPVIASDHPIYRSCCADGAGILAKPDDWHGAMSALAASQDRRAAVHAAASTRLLNEYTPAKLYGQLMNAFRAAGASSVEG
jgi:glycosyltransferase involved in cell wall biosynthesis